MLEVLLLAFLYGQIMEALNIYMSRQMYVYSGDFLLQLGGVPLAIGAGWSIIYYVAQKIAGRFDLAWWQSPLLMAFIALSFDLSIDAIAIRLGFWHWKIPLDQDWFGVPYDNFFGWLAVVWTFGLIMNLSYQSNVKPRIGKLLRLSAPLVSALLLGAQIMSYQGLAALLSGKYDLRQINAFNDRQDYAYAFTPEVRTVRVYLFLFIIVTLTALCASWLYRQRNVARPPADRFPQHVAIAIHLLFITFLFLSGIYKVSWLLTLVSFSVLALDLVLAKLPIGRA
jgi:hypothetical protein